MFLKDERLGTLQPWTPIKDYKRLWLFEIKRRGSWKK